MLTDMRHFESIKEQANTHFKSGEYAKAAEVRLCAFSLPCDFFLWLFLRQAYKQALMFPSVPVETRRILLSNRAQCYIFLGELDAALNDTTLALSDALTTLESP